jgi:hypothetical protein
MKRKLEAKRRFRRWIIIIAKLIMRANFRSGGTGKSKQS